VGFFQKIIAVITLIGATGSMCFLYAATSSQTPFILLILFSGWVLSPYLGLFIATLISRKWKEGVQLALLVIAFFVSIVSLIGYTGIFTPVDARPASIFLIIPFIGWIILVVFFILAWMKSARN